MAETPAPEAAASKPLKVGILFKRSDYLKVRLLKENVSPRAHR